MWARISRVGLFPVTFTLAMVSARWAHTQGAQADAVLAAVTLTTVVVVGLFERLLPAYPEWNIPANDVGTDVIHALVSMIALPQALELALKVGILSCSLSLAGQGFAIWPHHWNIAAQLGLAMLVSQFFEYWAHRLGHTVPLLWRLHATHHSPVRLYWLNAARFHPLDSTISFSLSMASLLLLGAGDQMLLLVAVWTSVHGLFQHANIDVRLGPLNAVFSMAELHRWHHSKRLEEANANYGNNILLWDWVFGTVYWPHDQRADSDIGLKDMDEFPQDYWGQLISPFTWPPE